MDWTDGARTFVYTFLDK